MAQVTTMRDGLLLVLKRTINAPRSAVWRCWSEPKLLKQWFCPKPWQVSKADFNLRPGGRMNTIMTGPDGEEIKNTGIFLEIIEGEKLTVTDAFTEGFIPVENSFVTCFVELSDTKDGNTHLVWGARHKNSDDVEKHLEMGFETGWKIASEQLEKMAQSLVV